MNQEESRQALEAESRHLGDVISAAIRQAERSSAMEALVAPDVRNGAARLMVLVRHTPPVTRAIDAYALAYLLYKRHAFGIAGPGEFAFGVLLFSDLSQIFPDWIPKPIKMLLLARESKIDIETYNVEDVIDAAASLAEYGADAGDEEALGRAEELEQDMLSRLPVNHPHRSALLNNLAFLTVVRLRRSGARLDSDLLRTRADELLDAAEHSPYSIQFVLGAAELLGTAQGVSEAGPTLMRTLHQLRRAKAGELEEGQRPRVLLVLGRLLSRFSDESHSSEVMEEAADDLREAVATTSPASPLYPEAVILLVRACIRLGSGGAMSPGKADAGTTELTDALRLLVAVDDGGILDDASTLQIGLVLYESWKDTGDPEFLTRSLRRLAAKMDDESLDPGTRRSVLDLLVAGTTERALATLTRSDVHTAIHWATEICGPPASWTAESPLGPAAQLARLYRAEWQATGNTASLEAAIEAFSRIVTLDEERGNPNPMYRHNLGSLTLRLGEATGDIERVREAIVHLRRAVDICQERDRDRGMYLHNLGGALAVVYGLTRDVGSLHEAVAVARAAVAATPADYPDRLAHLSQLTAVLTAAYYETGDLDLLEEAVGVLRSEMPSTLVDDQQVLALLHLAQALIRWGHATGNTNAVEEGRLTARQAASLTTPDPVHLLQARQYYAQVCVTTKHLDEASAVYKEAVQLLEQLPRWASARQEREGALARLQGLASDAAAIDILRGEPLSATSLLETGRGILLARGTDYYRQIAELHRTHPRLAESLSDVRQQRDAASESTNFPLD